MSTQSLLRGLPKDVRKLVKNALAQGATLEPGGKHTMLVYNGKRLPISRGNEYRSVKNLQRSMRNYLDLEADR